MDVVKNTIYYTKPDVYFLADDSAAWAAPFVSLEMYQTLLKPFYKRHYDLALENNMLIQHHNCGKCEIFIPDWLEMGVNAWDPAQTSNDLVGIKQKYGDKLTIVGGWDNTGRISSLETSDDELLEALYKYVDTFAPGGHFIFSAHVQGDKDDPVNIRKSELIKKFYFDYVKDWYKNH